MKKIVLHNRLILLYFVSLTCLFLSCKSNEIAKGEAKARDMAILEKLHSQNNYRIAVEVVYPFTSAATARVTSLLLTNTGDTANRIDLSGDGNFIQIENDTVIGYLPFFGESRINAGKYGGSSLSIQFKQPLKDLKKQINYSKGKLELEFTAHQEDNESEKYDINLEIYPNKSVDINITPTYKTFTRYSGTLVPFDEEK